MAEQCKRISSADDLLSLEKKLDELIKAQESDLAKRAAEPSVVQKFVGLFKKVEQTPEQKAQQEAKAIYDAHRTFEKNAKGDSGHTYTQCLAHLSDLVKDAKDALPEFKKTSGFRKDSR